MKFSYRTKTIVIRSKAIQTLFLLFFIMFLLSCTLTSAPKDPNPAPEDVYPTATKSVPKTIVTIESEASPPPIATIPSSQSEVIPSATSVWSSGTETIGTQQAPGNARVSYQFREEDCGCASFPAVVDAIYGPGHLECIYNWSGDYVDDNSLSFMIQQYDLSVDLERYFNETVSYMSDAARLEKDMIDAGSLPGEELTMRRDDPEGIIYLYTMPGGFSSKTEGEIPMCGHGNGIFRAPEDYLVEIRMFACDLGDDRQVYHAAMDTLEACALSNLERAFTITP